MKDSKFKTLPINEFRSKRISYTISLNSCGNFNARQWWDMTVKMLMDALIKVLCIKKGDNGSMGCSDHTWNIILNKGKERMIGDIK